MVSRNIAYKMRISDIIASEYKKSMGEFESNYIEFKEKNISRVNIISFVIHKYEIENYTSILIDDGTSQISIKSWNEDKKIMEKTNVGDVILLIGKIRQNKRGGSLYIHPEIIKKLDKKWLLARKKELEREYGPPQLVETKQDFRGDDLKIEEVNVSNETLRTRILNTIDKLDKDKGVLEEDIYKSIKSAKIKEVIEELLKEGEIFEINGRYKLLR